MAAKPLILILICVNFSLCSEGNQDNYRLPNDVIPSKYTISIETWLEPNFEFRGKVNILVKAHKETRTVTLHSYKLNYGHVNVTLNDINNRRLILADRAEFIKEYQTVTITFKEPLKKGQEYEININYEGELRDDMSGYYKSSYKTPDGKTRWLATTQFQATHARSAFPCFDEPAMKATFEIELIHDSAYNAVSNMPSKGKWITRDDRVRTAFQESVVMSTYLVAFIVSDFDFTAKSQTGMKYRVYSAPHTIDQTMYALKMTPKVLRALEDLTGIEYKLKKLDQAAIPDFAAGAMENWGLVTYREMYLLYNEVKSTTKSKEEILTIIAHELTHQWFGNLVTCDWWEHTWLNEGFAAYFQRYIPSLIEPTWRILDRYVVEVAHRIMVEDSLETTRPMSHPVATPSEISAMFDGISYDKASAVIHMMMHALGKDAFTKGLHEYLSKNSFKTGLPHKLFDALASIHQGATILPETAKIPDIFSSWSSQAGFPLITVTRDYSSGSMTLVQERYFTVPPSTKDESKWWIPITYTTSHKANFTDTRPSYWMNKNGETLTIPADHKDGWIIVNNQNAGYYRVNYDDENWKVLAAVLKSKTYDTINVLNRAQLIDDSLNLAKIGKIKYELALDILSYLHQEADYVPWAAAQPDLKFLDRMLDGTEEYPKYKSFVLSLVKQNYENLGYDESPKDEHIDVFNRINTLTWACKMGHEECVNKSLERLRAVMDDSKNATIPPNLHNVIYCSALKHGGKEEWDFLWNRYLKSDLSSESVILLNALGCTNDKELLRNYLEKTIEEDSKIRDQDTSRAFNSVSMSSDQGMMIALNFMEEKLPLMIEHYASLNGVKNIIEVTGAAVSSEEQYKLFNEILDKYEDSFSDSLKIAAKTARESMNDNREWWQKNLEEVTEWVKINSANGILSSSYIFISCVISHIVTRFVL